MKSLSFKIRILALICGVLFFMANNFAYAQQSCASIFRYQQSQNETIRFNSPKSFIDRLLSGFSKNLIENIEFEGPAFSKAQFKALSKFANAAGKPLASGDKVRAIRFEELKSEIDTPVGRQFVRENGPYENRLLKESNIDEKPREVLSFRIFYHDDTVVETPILIKGDLNSVNFDEGASQLFDFLKGNSTGIKIVEIAHTHPTYSALITSKDGSTKYRANELSEGDMVATIDFAKRFPHGMYIMIKGIVPNGFNYSSVVTSGR